MQMVPMVYDLAAVVDKGTYWQVTNVISNTLENIATDDEKYLKLSNGATELIKQAIENNNLIKISKTLLTEEVMPGEIDIIKDNEIDGLKASKDASLVKIRMLVTPEMSKIAGLTLYRFMMLNNDLSSAGFFITDNNREEMYLKILETENADLIQKLEDFLNHKDELDMAASFERKFTKYQSEILKAPSEDKVAELEQNFLDDYFTNF
jgi:hypothetical protein